MGGFGNAMNRGFGFNHANSFGRGNLGWGNRGWGGGWGNRGYGWGGGWGNRGLGWGGGWGGRGWGWGGGWGGRGWGWGGGWGYPFLGYGFGYPYMGFGYGYGWGGLFGSLLYGLGGGYGGYGGWGYGGYGGYASPYYGYGSGTGYYSNQLAYDSGYYGVTNAAAVTVPAVTSAQPVQLEGTSTSTAMAGTTGFAQQGEAAFKSGDYNGAVYAWKHAIVDDPQNPVVLMMIGQALFATGKYNEAAGATQAAMQALPKDQWDVVVKNYRELYGNGQDYTDQLRALEKAVKDKPDDPAQRFLLGFHYAYLGYPQQAVEQLDKALRIAPRDEAAKQLRTEMQNKLPKPITPPAPPAPMTSQRLLKLLTATAA